MTVINIDLSELSGVDPNIQHLKGARIDFSPYRAFAIDPTWVTRNIVRIKAPNGVATAGVPPTPTGNAYEVQERGFRGARHGYVLVPDSPSPIKYIDLVWVDKTTLDPDAPLDPAWVAELEAAVADIETAQSTADSALTAAGAASAAATSAHAAADAAQDDVDALEGVVSGKADTSSLAPVATTGQYADLVGTVPTSALPPLAVTDVNVVASQAAMLALTAQRGDVAVRTDNSKTYILAADAPTVLANWKEIVSAGAVQSVAGKTGTVSLAKVDVGLDQIDNTSDVNKPLSTPQATAKVWAKNPDQLVAGAVTYTSGLMSSAIAEWPDGKAGVLTVTSRQPGTDAVTGYTITHVDGATTLTYTQPTITRDSSGSATVVPQITVA